MSYIIDWRNDAALDPERVGGKGASLGRLKREGLNVPDYFVIATDAFRAMDGTSLSEGFLAELRDAYDGIGAPTVAVRSSATSEDSTTASHAGLYETVLDVTGFEALVDALRHCWSSFHAGFAGEYRAEHGVGADDAMAVVVQKYVPASWAGVCFTADPVRPALSRMVVNAVAGIGEALVSGSKTPEQFVLDFDSGRLLSRSSGEDGEPLPQAILRSVWEISKQIAGSWQFPQDIEWAVADEIVYVLQSRPITTLGALFHNRPLEPWKDTPGDAEDPDKLWSRVYADEIWSSPISPLFYNVQNLSPSFAAWRRWHHDSRPLSSVVFKYHKAAAYVDVDILREKYEYHPRMARIEGVLGFFPSHMREQVKRASFRWWGRLRRHLSMEFQDRRVRSLAHNYRHLEEVWPALIERTDRWFDLDLDALSLDELREHQQEVRQEQIRVSQPCQYAVVYHAHDMTFFLTGLLDRWFGDGGQLYAQATSGLSGGEAVKEANQVWHLARLIRSHGESTKSFVRHRGWNELIEAVEDLPALTEFRRELIEFWRTHRHRGASYKDLIYPRWGDEPDLLLNLIKGYLDSDAVQPIEQNARQGEQRRALQEELLARLGGRFAESRRRLLRTLFRYNEIYMGLRDDHRFYFDRIWYSLRRIYLSYGRRLADCGILGGPDEVFFLGTEEIEQGLAGRLPAPMAAARIASRRQDWNETLGRQPPKFLKGYLPAPDVELAPDTSSMKGIGASPGTVSGRARVVRSLAELSELQDREILVTRQTDPSWTAVFPRIAGLILETGGALAHGASLCREYGLPCVTAVDGAMERIPNGAIVALDGAAGIVTITER